jgi:ParB/RepB/Spo0J family partition protein
VKIVAFVSRGQIMAGKTTLRMIPLSDVRANEVALREVNRGSEKFLGLVEAIKAQGIMNPISVRIQTDKSTGKEYYEIIDGLHRFTAAGEAGLDEIPAQIMDKSDADVLYAQIIGNVQRVDTKPMEYTQGLLRILGMNPLMTEAELAVSLGMSPAWIGQRLSLNKLHEKVAAAVNEGEIPLSNAFAMTKLPQEEQLNWIDRAMTMGTAEFSPMALARAKEIRDANRKGNDGPAEEWKPQPFLRKMGDIKGAYETDITPIAAAIKEAGLVLESDSEETAQRILEAAKLGVAWTLNMDPISQEESRQRHIERTKKEEEAKAKRDAERKAQRAKEAEEKQAKAKKEAEEAQAKLKAENEAKIADLEQKAAEAKEARGETITA